MQYFFTFGEGQKPGLGYYVVIDAEDEVEAREIIQELWGPKWSMQYPTAMDAGVEQYGLIQITERNRDEWESKQVCPIEADVLAPMDGLSDQAPVCVIRSDMRTSMRRRDDAIAGRLRSIDPHDQDQVQKAIADLLQRMDKPHSY